MEEPAMKNSSKRIAMILPAVIALVLGVSGFAQQTLLHQVEEEFVKLHDQLRPSVVNIDVKGKVDQEEENGPSIQGLPDDFFRFFGIPFPNVPGPQGRKRPGIPMMRGTGSGFIYDAEGHIITNNHVVESASEIKVRLYNGNEYDATVVGRDPEGDVAVIKIEPKESLVPVRLGDSDKLRVGQLVMAMGSPRGLEGTVSFGHISALGREGLTDLAMQGLTFQNLVQTDAAINLGNSGGPLVNIDGEVIGINVAIVAGANSIGFAIPINTAKAVIPTLIEKGKVSRGYLGVSIRDAKDFEAKDTLNLPDNDGALVNEVQPNTPADQAGIKPYDVIRKVNGEPTRSAAEVMRKIASYPPGTTVSVEIIRNGQTMTIPVTLAERDPDLLARQQGGTISPDEKTLGLSVQNIDPGTRKNLGLEDSVNGVLVTNVDPAGPAAEARLEPGDVILEVGQQPISNTTDFWKRVGELKQPGKAILLRIRRANGNSEITILRVPKN